MPGTSRKQKKLERNKLLEARIAERIRLEQSWLNGDASEPMWPAFPIKRAKPRPPRKRTLSPETPEPVSKELMHVRVDYHRAALWLGH